MIAPRNNTHTKLYWLQQTSISAFNSTRNRVQLLHTCTLPGQIYGVTLFPGLAFDCLQYAKMEGKGLEDLAKVDKRQIRGSAWQRISRQLFVMSIQGMEAPWSICNAAWIPLTQDARDGLMQNMTITVGYHPPMYLPSAYLPDDMAHDHVIFLGSSIVAYWKTGRPRSEATYSIHASLFLHSIFDTLSDLIGQYDKATRFSATFYNAWNM